MVLTGEKENSPVDRLRLDIAARAEPVWRTKSLVLALH